MVQITVTVMRARDHPLREQLVSIGAVASARTIGALALTVAVLGAIIVGALEGDVTREHGGARAAQARAAGPAGVAAAYGYPLRRLSITISASNPAYARAHVDRTSACAQHHGYVNASFHWIGGTWSLVLDEGQLFVPNDLLARCRAGRTGCRLRSDRSSQRRDRAGAKDVGRLRDAYCDARPGRRSSGREVVREVSSQASLAPLAGPWRAGRCLV